MWLPPCERPSAGGSLPRAWRGHLPSPTRGNEPIAMVICSSPSILCHPPIQRFGLVSPAPRTTPKPLSFLQILPLLHASSLTQVSSPFISLTTASLFSARHWVTNPTEKLLGWRTVMFFWGTSRHHICWVTWRRSSLSHSSWCVDTKLQQV